ncbi:MULTISPECIES: hypothetical protein [Bacillaceae]|uniref:Uncharacterized protein n=1 Tax=Alkalicoccobacillus plakortidis TaxID=444060 RepID=A0A9D5HXU0_9BACI|nr:MULTISPECIES: hypothetical protein [Bacillaceae]KQL57111.1 hypothetical protein AN965_10590 [Alkalicoccobacillus plakortidis]RQW21419.1 hypothetical protein EH196_15410 [Bacillus sp. C1-1]
MVEKFSFTPDVKYIFEFEEAVHEETFYSNELDDQRYVLSFEPGLYLPTDQFGKKTGNQYNEVHAEIVGVSEEVVVEGETVTQIIFYLPDIDKRIYANYRVSRGGFTSIRLPRQL